MVNLNYDGVLAFRSEGSEYFPVKVMYYQKEYYVVPDWSVNHDPGDEDDGEHKSLENELKERELVRRVRENVASARAALEESMKRQGRKLV